MAPDASPPAAWRALALDPPLAHGPVVATGTLRAEPEDFQVEELLSFEPDGGTAHLLLRVEKRSANTLYVARALARAAGVRNADVGFAGLKDRHAVATQWFTVPATAATPGLAGLRGEGFQVLEAHPHSRKLRRGALAGNRFRLRLRDLEADADKLRQRVAAVALRGVPNYFGPQRFGMDGANLGRVSEWLAHGDLPRARESRGFVLSAARALAFNAVLADRVAAGDWDRLLPGEVANLAGSGSVFHVAEITTELERRCADGDLHPSGPLPGERGMQPDGEAGDRERAALARCAPVAERLAAAGLQAERRALRLVPGELEFDIDGGCLALSFRLGRGSFATAMLRELVLAKDAARISESDE